jgi:hypothetical protein
MQLISMFYHFISHILFCVLNICAVSSSYKHVLQVGHRVDSVCLGSFLALRRRRSRGNYYVLHVSVSSHPGNYILLVYQYPIQVRMVRGYNSRKVFEDQVKLLPKDLKRRLKYFRVFLQTRRIHLYPLYSKTERDGERYVKYF